MYMHVCDRAMSNENTCFKTCLFFSHAVRIFALIGKYDIVLVDAK